MNGDSGVGDDAEPPADVSEDGPAAGTPARSGRGRPRARSAEDQQKVRQRFLDCARALFASEGASALTMRRLAAEAGYSPGTIYLYFPGRRDLLRVIWAEDMYGLLDAMTACERPGEDAATILRNVLLSYVGFWFDRPDHFRGMFLENEKTYRDDRASFAEDESVQSAHHFLLNITGRAFPDLSPDRVGVMCHSLLAAVHGVVALHIGNQGFRWSDRSEMILTVIDGLFAGLGLTNPALRKESSPG